MKRNKSDAPSALADVTRKRGQWSDVLSRLFRNKIGLLGVIIVLLLVVLTVFAPLFTRYPYDAQSFPDRFKLPDASHIMGTDNFGRDLWTRLLYGGRISLLIAILASVISNFIGVFIGSVSGYFGSKTDTVIMRALDILMAIPPLLLAIAISSSLGSGPVNTALAISLSGIPYSARIIRSTVMSIKDSEFVEAARATGSRHLRVIFRHILPNTIAPLIVGATLGIGANIMAISGLSFIGLGVHPPIPEWGSILADGRAYIRDFWPIIVFPSIFIMLTILGFNLFGDALRDALDPRLKD
ncbi:MAG: ABC transporter permease [Oscillospiraceae bacterium]|nr:ABC transporter permease [Oscillospiraceae bacterium]